MNKSLFQSSILLLVIGLTTMSFTSSLGFWEKLGSRIVSYKTDFDEIYVTAREGSFKAIKLEVSKAAVDFDRVVVVYRNGQRERLHIRNIIPAGGQTRVLDLAGRNRIINRVIFYYRTPAHQGIRAKVKLYGL